MTDRHRSGDVIELRRPPASRIPTRAAAPPRRPLLDYLQDLGLIDLEQFALAISDLTDLRQRGGQEVVHRQAAANLLAAIVTLRCGLSYEAVDGILEVAADENKRLERRL